MGAVSRGAHRTVPTASNYRPGRAGTGSVSQVWPVAGPRPRPAALTPLEVKSALLGV
jgi:hypothetical protein